MKRLILIGISILLLLIDNTILPYYNIKGAFPSLLFVFAIAYSIVNGKKEAIFIGILSGFLQDIFFFYGAGINIFLNFLLCLLAAIIGDNIFKENRIIPTLSCLFISILKVLGVVLIFKVISLSVNIETALLSAVFNSIWMIIVYKIVLTTSDKYMIREVWRFK